MTNSGTILLAEDREDDALLLRRALEKSSIDNPLFIVRDGQEAIDFLGGIGRFSNRAEYPLPSLFLMDLKMPRLDGFEVLSWILDQPALAALPVIVFTASTSVRDMSLAYELGARSVVLKPSNFEDTVQMLKTMTDFWLRTDVPPFELGKPVSIPAGSGTSLILQTFH